MITLDTIRLLGLRRRRGVRAGRNKQIPISVVSHRSRDRLCPNATVNVNNSVKSDCARNVVPVRCIRHTQPTVRSLKFGSLNVRSLSPSKLET